MASTTAHLSYHSTAAASASAATDLFPVVAPAQFAELEPLVDLELGLDDAVHDGGALVVDAVLVLLVGLALLLAVVRLPSGAEVTPTHRRHRDARCIELQTRLTGLDVNCPATALFALYKC